MTEFSQEISSSPRLPEGLSLKAAQELFEGLPISNDNERKDLALTILDFKVGTTIKPPDPMLTKMTTELLQGLELSYVAGDKEGWYVAKSEADAQKLHQVFEVTQDVREQGRMSGYPESAVENYARKMEQVLTPGKTEAEILNILKESDGNTKVPLAILKEDYMAFLSFQLSADNWQEELKTVERWAEAIKKFDPQLFKRIVVQHRLHKTVSAVNKRRSKQ